MSRLPRPAPRAATLWAFAVGALAGCAGAPPAEPAPPRVAPAWQAPQDVAGTAVPDATWWSRFDDPLLPELVAAAQAASPSVSGAAARIERARASRVAAGAALLPQVDAAASVYRSRDNPPDPAIAAVTLGVQASWEIDLFGANTAGRRAAQARLEGEQALLHGARTAVAAEVATTYAALRACEARRATAQADADSRGETSRLTGLSARSGFTAPADAALARAGAAQSRSLLLAQAAQCESLVKSLVELSDLPEPELRQRLASGTARVPQPPALALPALPAQLLAQRPDLVQAGRTVQAAAGDREQAAAQQWPRVTLSGSVAAGRVNFAGESTNVNTWSIGPLTVSFPLFDGGARAANRSAAEAAYTDAQAQYRAIVRRAVREVESGLVTLQAVAARQADAQLAAADFESSLRATQARQRGGLASLFDLEAARRNAVAAQAALIDLQRERAEAWIALYRALGGGFNADAVSSLALAPASHESR